MMSLANSFFTTEFSAFKSWVRPVKESAKSLTTAPTCSVFSTRSYGNVEKDMVTLK